MYVDIDIKIGTTLMYSFSFNPAWLLETIIAIARYFFIQPNLL